MKKSKITNTEIVEQPIVICNNSENVLFKSEKIKETKTPPTLPLLFTPDPVIVTTMYTDKKEKRKTLNAKTIQLKKRR